MPYQLIITLLMLLPFAAIANESGDHSQYSAATAWRSSYEIVPIKDDEMGILGLHYDIQPIEAFPNSYLGLGGYGGLTGNEGGFFTMGATFGHRFPINDQLKLDFGLHLGGGGGSRFTFPGGGLIVRPHLALELRQQAISWRLGVTQTQFPNSTNPHKNDTHLFVGMRLHSYDWRKASNQISSTFKPFSGDYSTFRITPSMLYYLTDDEQPLHRSGEFTGSGKTNADIPLLGVKIEQFFSDQSYRGLEFYGAGGGGADGYAAILASVGHVTPLASIIQWDNKLTAGMAGDGRLDTGGGLVAQLATGFNLSLSEHWYAKAMVGRLVALDGNMQATVIDLGIGWQAKKPLATANSSALFSQQQFNTIPWRSTLLNKSYLPASHLRNKSGDKYDEHLHLIGFSLTGPINDWFALSGSTSWAYEGNIGSYAEGMMGFSLTPALDKQQQWRAKLAYEIGVAGGGVMAIDGGVIHQLNAGLLYQINQQLSTDLTIGRMASIKNQFEADVIQVQLTWHHNSLFLRDL